MPGYVGPDRDTRGGRWPDVATHGKARALAASISAEDDYLRVDVAHIAEVAAALRASQPKGGTPPSRPYSPRLTVKLTSGPSWAVDRLGASGGGDDSNNSLIPGG